MYLSSVGLAPTLVALVLEAQPDLAQQFTHSSRNRVLAAAPMSRFHGWPSVPPRRRVRQIPAEHPPVGVAPVDRGVRAQLAGQPADVEQRRVAEEQLLRRPRPASVVCRRVQRLPHREPADHLGEDLGRMPVLSIRYA